MMRFKKTRSFRPVLTTKQWKKIFKGDKTLQELADAYANNFTIHGAARITQGSKYERVVWSFLLLTAGIFICFVVREFVIKYLSNETYTSVNTVVAKMNYFPSITICIEEQNKNTFCGYSTSLMALPQHKGCKESGETPVINDTVSRYSPWGHWWGSNSLKFHVECYNKLHSKCGSDFYTFEISKGSTDGKCYTWNQHGKFYNQANKMGFMLLANSSYKNFYITLHSSDLYGVFHETSFKTSKGFAYEIYLQKTQYERLPPACTSKTDNLLFPGTYSPTNCRISDKCKVALIKCGKTFDYCNKYMPANLLKQFQRNITNYDAYKCLRSFDRDDESDEKMTKDCEAACQEESYVISTSSHPTESDTLSEISIKYQQPNKYISVKEHPLYSWEQLLSDTGGLMGLVIGASVLSIVEIINYLILSLLALLNRKKRKRKEQKVRNKNLN